MQVDFIENELAYCLGMRSRYEHQFLCLMDMMDRMKKRPTAGSLLILSSTTIPCEHGFCPSELSVPRQGHTLSFHGISEIYLWRKLIWKSLMTHSCPAAAIFGSQMQNVLTGGDPSASDCHCKWDLQGSGPGTEPLTIFCNDLGDERQCSKS